jgi:uncharacterized membrane protein
MESWIPITFLAVFTQNARAMLQKNMAEHLSVGGATYARFLYGVPVTCVLAAAALAFTGESLPLPNAVFFGYAVICAVAQIVGNTIFVHLVRASNFTVITTYTKTETVIGGLLSFVILDDALSVFGASGVVVTLLGVMVLAAAGRGSLTVRSLLWSLGSRDALYGVAVGALYAVGSTSIRGAILALDAESPAVGGFVTLAWVTLIQAVVMGVWLAAKQPLVLRATFKAWRAASWIGITGGSSSAAWYVAFSMEVTAYVLAVGQIELVLTYLVSRFMYKETTRWGEIAGILVTVVGILIVVLGR